MEHEGTVLSEISQTQESKYCVVSLMHRIIKKLKTKFLVREENGSYQRLGHRRKGEVKNINLFIAWGKM